VFLVVAFLFVAAPGYTLFKGLTFSKRKLERPNPTSYVFDAPISQVRNAVDTSLSLSDQNDALEGSWMPTGLNIHCCNETEYDILQGRFTKSRVYQWLYTPLEYTADFKLRLTPISGNKTQVDVVTSDSKVRIGSSFSAHGGDYYERVAPTTIEEYTILSKIGQALGQPGMPALLLPK
jgi:hypothetical protein